MASLGKQISDFFSGDNGVNDEGLRGLFVDELKGIYYAERAILDNLPQMADAATTDQVRDAFMQHVEETRNQVTRLERIFDSIGVEVDDKTCNAIDGLADDGDNVISNTEDGSLTRDAGLIIAAQKVEHHEIAVYGSLHTLARLLGYTEAVQLLEQTLQEEKNTDKKLTQIAESFINERAKSEDRDTDDYGKPHSWNDDQRKDSTWNNDENKNNDHDAVTPDGTRYDSGSQNYNYGSTAGATLNTESGMNYGGSTNTDTDSSSSTRSSSSRTGDATAGGPLGV